MFIVRHRNAGTFFTRGRNCWTNNPNKARAFDRRCDAMNAVIPRMLVGAAARELVEIIELDLDSLRAPAFPAQGVVGEVDGVEQPNRGAEPNV